MYLCIRIIWTALQYRAHNQHLIHGSFCPLSVHGVQGVGTADGRLNSRCRTHGYIGLRCIHFCAVLCWPQAWRQASLLAVSLPSSTFRGKPSVILRWRQQVQDVWGRLPPPQQARWVITSPFAAGTHPCSEFISRALSTEWRPVFWALVSSSIKWACHSAWS